MLGMRTAAEMLVASIHALRMDGHAQDKEDSSARTVPTECSVRPARAFKGEREAREVAVGLPAGCAVGTPFVAGTPATEMPVGKGLLSVAMEFVQNDDYHGLMELARCGQDEVFEHKRRCGFSMTLMPESGSAKSLPTSLRVQGASMLHYAVCIGSFRAAAALLIVNPSLLRGTCKVTVGEAREMHRAEEESWDALELASLFCELYDGSEADCEIQATRQMYEQSFRILELGLALPKRMPFLNLPTVQERVAAAGPFAEDALEALIEAAESTSACRRSSSV